MSVSKAYFDAATGAAIGEFYGFLKPDEFKDIANQLIKLLTDNRLKKQINNIKEMKVLPQETQNWLNTNWFPRAQTAGLKYFAFVVPDDVFGKMSMDGANREAEERFAMEIKYFKDMPSAKAWIKAKA